MKQDKIRLGIGIVTFNRKENVMRLVRDVNKYTKHSFTLVIADDGSVDGSFDLLRQHNFHVITGKNMGVCWNKNRALFYLVEIMNCNVVILLEDDTFPVRENWEDTWIKAAIRYGHVGLAGKWFQDKFIAGNGSIATPYISSAVSGQCSAFSSESLAYVGYLDTRFKGYGVGHAEHSMRFIRAGYGGKPATHGQDVYHFYLIDADLEVTDPGGNRVQEQVDRNHQLLESIKNESIYRKCWRDDEEMSQMRSEVREASAVFEKLFSSFEDPALASKDAHTLPSMTEVEQAMLLNLMQSSTHYLEFGTGGSTVLAALNVRSSVTSVDSSHEWLTRTAKSCRLYRAPIEPLFVYADIGPVGVWGYPIGESHKSQWPNYVTDVWKTTQARSCDLCLIDGRFRVASFISTLIHTAPDTIVLIHDFLRAPYQSVLEFADPIATAESLTAFRRKCDFDVARAASVLEIAKFEPG